MEILYLLVPLGVLVALGSALAFWAAAENGQFDDLDEPARAILADPDDPQQPG